MNSWPRLISPNLVLAPFLMVMLPMLPGGVLAHDFKVGILAPISGKDAATGREAVNGFILAAAERDGHPDEEADGHLGGLDVYLLVVDTGGGRAEALARVRALIRKPGLHFLGGRIPADWMGDIQKMLQESPAILIQPGKLSVQETLTMGGTPLAAAYARKFGGQPGPSARLGYSLARLLDRAVRITGDDFSNRARVLAALTRAGYR